MHKTLAALALLVARVAGDACTGVAFNTLSNTCNGVCAGADDSCVVYPSLSESPCNLEDMSELAKCETPVGPTGCAYQCFAPPTKPALGFSFYVLFNALRETKQPPAAQRRHLSVDDIPSEMNQFVKRVGPLKLDASVTRVVISGGRDENTGTRGSFVDLEIDPKMMAGVENATLVGLVNINLGLRQPDVAALLPPTVTALDISNTNLTKIPASMAKLPGLRSWAAERNYITEYPATLKPVSLTSLLLTQNELKEFKTNLSSLQSLDLSNNKLQTFPTIVFSFKNLRSLRLAENPEMTTVVFTEDQYSFLTKLESFTIDDDALDRVSCDAEQRRVVVPLSESTVCVVSDEAYAKYKGTPRSTTPTPEPSATKPPTTAPVATSTPAPTVSTNSGNDGMSTTVVVVLIVGGIVIGAALVAAFFLLRKRSGGKSYVDGTDSPVQSEPMPSRYVPRPSGMSGQSGSRGGASTGQGTGSSGPTRKARHAALLLSADSALSSGQSLWDDDEMLSFQLDYEGIEDVRLIGSGGFAIVWLVKYAPHNRLLASKRLIRDQITRHKTMEFVGEIKLGMKLHHPNIVEFVGVAWTVETDLQALFEYMPNGDLRAYLEPTERTPTPWDRQKLRIAIDVIDALVYVHSFSPPLVHRDLKSRNVLLTEELRAKLSDFGVSRYQSDNGTMTSGVGTGKWLAPEVIAGARNYTCACDIYAFGVLLSELDTHALPYDDLRGPQGNRLPEVAVMQMVAVGQVRPTLSPSCPSEVRRIADLCLAFDPATRPSAVRVAQLLSGAMTTLPVGSTII